MDINDVINYIPTSIYSHRKMMLRKHLQEKEESQSQSQPSSNDEKTVDEITINERCGIPREIFNEIEIIASTQKKTNCEVQIEIFGGYVEQKRLERDWNYQR
ncbi:MAG TPA: hypothetical protein VEL11_00365 [Candidatus Bathyarchaeia archaeon]|nr:hypothetical protein [Candidatus Bathyarchaeia archaeon]